MNECPMLMVNFGSNQYKVYRTMSFEKFTRLLVERMKAELPGQEAQYRLAPKLRMSPDVGAQYYHNARKGGVLALFYPIDNVPHTVFIQRPKYEGVHSGQIAFPGGSMEEDDRDIIHTALREAEEEVGVLQHQVEVVGQLTEVYIPPSNFLVNPVVAICTQRPDFVLQQEEVADIIEVSVPTLLDESLVGNRQVIVFTGQTIESPGYDIDGKIIWGATAMMLGELTQILFEVTTLLEQKPR